MGFMFSFVMLFWALYKLAESHDDIKKEERAIRRHKELIEELRKTRERRERTRTVAFKKNGHYVVQEHIVEYDDDGEYEYIDCTEDDWDEEEDD